MATQSRGLLYVDILGTKNLWQTRGISKGRGRMDVFASLVADGVSSAQRDFEVKLISGEIGTDSAGFLFASVDDAVLAGMRVYQTAYSYDESQGVDARIYLRGVIVSTDDAALPTRRRNHPKLKNVARVFHSEGLMEAVILENSGIKGMRLIVERSTGSRHIWSQAAERYWARKQQKGSLPIVVTLGTGFYPSGRKMLDVQWPLDTRGKLRQRANRLQQRQIAAKNDPEEKSHLSTTQVLFSKCAQLMKNSR